MIEIRKPKFTEISWQEALPSIAKVNAPLADEIKKLNLGAEYTLIKASYTWGQHLVYENTFNIPDENGQLIAINHPSINNELRKKLEYNKIMPLGIVLNHSIELYIHANQRTIPLNFMSAGKLFGLSDFLQARETNHHISGISNIIAGTRSLIMLPKISDIFCYKKIKKEFNLRTNIPKGLLDQWEIFVELANHPKFPSPWHVEVLYFTDKWSENKKDEKWRIFREFLLNVDRKETHYLQDQMTFDLAFSCALGERNYKPTSYLADTIKHLYALGHDIFPGFKVATNDEAAPISGFQKIFSTLYGLKYAPTMMSPGYLSNKESQPIYYSLEMPTLMAFSPKSRKTNNKLNDLREIKHIMEVVSRSLSVYRLAEKVTFNYYHSDTDEYKETRLIRSLIEDDPTLKKYLRSQDKPFCETSAFLRGCIGITKKK